MIEVPLLFEGGGEKVFDTTVAVVAAEEVRRERAAARGHALVDEREARQLTQEEKAERAEHVVVNDGSVEDLEAGAVRAAREAEAMSAEGSAAAQALADLRRWPRSWSAWSSACWSRTRHLRQGDPGTDPAARPRGHHPPAGRMKRGSTRR